MEEGTQGDTGRLQVNTSRYRAQIQDGTDARVYSI